jgi:WD40 repeat protein
MHERGHGGAINLLSMSNSGHIVTGSADASVKLWEVGSKKPIAASKVTAGVICGQVVGDMVLTGNGDGNI